MKTFKKNPFELSAVDNPTYDKKYVYLTIRVDTRKSKEIIKPGDSPGGFYVLKYIERIEKNPNGDLLLVDGDLSWFNRMGCYDIKNLDRNEQSYKERRLSDIDSHLDEAETNKMLRAYLIEVFNVTYN